MAESQTRYTSIAVALHWAIAILMIVQVAGGLLLDDLPRNYVKLTAIQLHKSFGMLILLLTAIRIFWRLGHKPPPLPAAMPGWQKLASHSVHFGFYVLLIVMPLIGWAYVSASPFRVPTFLFWVIPLPDLPFFADLPNRKATAHELIELHEKGAFAMIGLFVLHVGAVVKHQFFDRDNILGRMTFGRGKA